VDWTPDQLTSANAKGWVPTNFVKVDEAKRVVRLPMSLPATVIDVIVE